MDRPQHNAPTLTATRVSVADATSRIPVGISSCLLGAEVRFDGGHKRDAYILGTLAQYFEFIPVCPEVAIGLSVPREPIRLVGNRLDPRAIGTKTTSLDATDRLRKYGQRVAKQLSPVCGYIFKKGSPSCGMERVKIYSERGISTANGTGIFARAFMDANPLIPCEEEGRLGDPVLRDNFIQRVFVLHRWRNLNKSRLTAGKLVEFHTRHKLILLAHGQQAYRRLGQIVAKAGTETIRDLADRYIAELMLALSIRATRKNHANVLLHLIGYLKKHLDVNDKAEMIECVDLFRRGLVPLIVPVTLLKHHFRHFPDPYVTSQYYLSPHPQELMLRNAL